MFKNSIKELTNTKTIAILAILIALQVFISNFFIPVSDGLRIYVTFFILALAGLISGPTTALIYGFIVDILSFIIHPSGPFFFGYTLTTMVGCFIYASFFYQQKITVLKIILAKTLVNVICNIGLNSLWNYMLFDKAFIYFFTKSLIKNIILLPIEILFLYMFFKLMLKTLNSMGYTKQNNIPKF